MEVVEKIVQMPLAESYAAKLEADAVANDRNTARQAAWVVKRYYDGLLVPALEGMSVAARVDAARGDTRAPQDNGDAAKGDAVATQDKGVAK